MPSNYQKICEDNIRWRGEGFDKTGYFFSEQLYGDRSHFVYELLQNAEDALERRFRSNPDNSSPCTVQFKLYHDRLEFRHFGALFNEDDVRGISDVLEGTKKEDFSQIGKFGIGFKSVYAFTASPEIHSGEEHFVIKRYIRPEAKTPDFLIMDNETVFNFPFDHEEFTEGAFNLILDKLRRLGPRVLLFLRRIDGIEWSVEPNGERGHYLKETVEVKNCEKVNRVTVIGQNNDKDVEENWLIFERPVLVPDGSYQVRVEVGFLLENKSNGKTGDITKIKDAPVVVYFPTEKATGFGFLIQGPYKTTPPRDNILKDDDWNTTLVRETAHLLTHVLPLLKELGLLTVSLLEALPIRMDDFPEGSMFYPIVVAVRKAFMDEDLLPADDGTFVSAQNAKLASAEWLQNLLQEEQLKLLYKTSFKWISRGITERERPDIWKYIKNELNVKELTPDSFVRKVDSSFFEKQSDQWMIDFYQQLSHQKALWKKGEYSWDHGALREKPFIRLQNCSHVSPFDKDNKPKVYLPMKASHDVSLPTVKVEIAKNDEVKRFLSDLGIPEFDIVAEVIEHVIPKYTSTSPPKSDEHSHDIEKIMEALKTDSTEKRMRLEKDLQKTPFILAKTLVSDEVYQKPNKLYFQDDALKVYFTDNPEVSFISSQYEKPVLQMFKDLGVSKDVRIQKKSPDEYDHTNICKGYGSNERGLCGFDPDIKVEELKYALASPSLEKSAFIWNHIAIPNWACIRGTVEISKKQTYENSRKEDKVSKNFGSLLIDSSWLPDKSGNWHKPNELFLTDLPKEFDSINISAKEVAIKLKMKQPEREQALEVVTEGNQELKKLIEYFQGASDSEREKISKMIPRNSLTETAPSFKDGLKTLGRPQRGTIEHGDKNSSPVSNLDRYQDNLNEGVKTEIKEHQSTPHIIEFSPVKDQLSNKEARNFLYEQYHGHCQVTKTTFLKASMDTDGVAKNYFESCSLLPYANANYLNDAGNMLCVSADTMAKFKHGSFKFIDSLEDAIETFKTNGKQAESVSVKIQLADEECYIKWSQRHFMRLIALYEEA